MKVLICGSRTITDIDLVYRAMAQANFESRITEITSGGAKGVDTLAERVAKEMKVKLTVVKADWEKYGKRAGPIRNAAMIRMCDAVVAVWDGKSRGTRNTISLAEKARKKCTVYEV